MMDWVDRTLGAFLTVGGGVAALVAVHSWADNVSPLTVVKQIPSAVRLVVGGLLLIGTANLVLWTPAFIAIVLAAEWLGAAWGLLFVWPGLIAGYYLLKLLLKPLLSVYSFISGDMFDEN